MDIFRLLSRGSKLEKNGKHAHDLKLISGKAQAEEQAAGAGSRSRAQDIDFFKGAQKKGSSGDKPKAPKEEEREEQDDDNEYGQDETPVLSITSEEDAKAHRKHHRIKVTGDDVPLPIASFDDLVTRFDLHKHLRKNLEHGGFGRPTPIQSEAIPMLLHGRDLVACAPTGSGKTLAFAVPMVQALKEHKTVGFRGLVVSPTKELATQIYNEFLKLSRGRDLSVCILSKAAVAKFRNEAVSKQKFDILVSTPLRLVEAVKEEIVDLSQVQHLVLDEADKLFEQGFLEQTDEIMAACTSARLQKCLFSATMPSGVEQLANTIMHAPLRVLVGHKEAASQDIEQKLLYTGNEEGKLIAVRQMIRNGEFVPPVIIFVQSIQRAKALFHELVYDKVNVDAIHGERTQAQRDKVIERFKAGDIWVLICTDVLARGIDFRGVNLVVNYDVPQSAQAYVHRIGRTGRAGRRGTAVTFFTKTDADAVRNVVGVMKQSGCDVGDWMLRMPKLSYQTKKQLKRKPLDRKEISTVPSVVRQKRKQRKDMIDASKRRKTATAPNTD